MRQFALLSALFCVLSIAGCDSGPKYAPAAGQVLLDGNPFPDVSVTFIASSGPSSVGEADKDGRFVLYGPGNKPGILPGEYVVILECPYNPAMGSSPDGTAPAESASSAGSCVVPEAYRQSTTSPLRVTIPAGGNEELVLQVSSQ